VGFDWLTIGFLKPVDSSKKPTQNKVSHQDTGIARTNLPPRARWLAKADAAFRQPSGIERAVTNPSLEILLRLAKQLDVEVGQLLLPPTR